MHTVSFSPWTSSLRAYPYGVIFWDMFNAAPDCHVPHSGTCNMQASKEVPGQSFGTIGTPEKFTVHRRITRIARGLDRP